MKILLSFFILFIYPVVGAQVVFTDYFSGERLRYNYVIAGNSRSARISELNFVREPFWGGSVKNLVDTFRYGELMVEVFDSATRTLLYSKGYSSLFIEWQGTAEAKQKERAFLESLVIPFPNQTIVIAISKRDSLSVFQHFHTVYFNPRISGFEHHNLADGIVVKNLHLSGPAENNVDVAIVSDGYTLAEKELFFSEAGRCVEVFFNWLPYKKQSDKFNFYAVFVPSAESGTDIPGDSVWRHTALNSSFYTFGSERYLTVNDMISLREAVSEVPYDQVCVMINTEKYGGGGIYNSFTVFSAKNEYSGFLFMHEFGHAFAGLADEYYTSPTAYEDNLLLTVEPYQPNITTRINFEAKWADMISDTLPVPTPDCESYSEVVGLFEGAAYQARGIYRPAFDCAMKSKTCRWFCPVCRRAIERMIRYTCGE